MKSIQFIGNLGKDATIADVNGKKVINFSAAVTDKSQSNESTTWFSCAYWVDRPALANILNKGSRVFVSGGFDIKANDKSSSGYDITIRVNSLEYLGSSSKVLSNDETANFDESNINHF